MDNLTERVISSKILLMPPSGQVSLWATTQRGKIPQQILPLVSGCPPAGFHFLLCVSPSVHARHPGWSVPHSWSINNPFGIKLENVSETHASETETGSARSPYLITAPPEPQSNLNSTYLSTRLIARKSPLSASSLYSSVPSAIDGRNVSSNSMKDR